MDHIKSIDDSLNSKDSMLDGEQSAEKIEQTSTKSEAQEELEIAAQTHQFMIEWATAKFEYQPEPDDFASKLLEAVTTKINSFIEGDEPLRNYTVYGLQDLVRMGVGVFGPFGTAGFFCHHLQ